MNIPPLIRCSLRSLCALTMGASLNSLQAQWIGTTSGLNYDDPTNWSGGVINDVFQGPYNWQSSPGVSNSNQLSFLNNSTSVSTGTINANSFVVGQTITGAGIPDGATVTAITGTNTISISTPTTSASSGVYTIAAINSPWNIELHSTRTLTNGFTYRNTDPANVVFTPQQSGGSIWNFDAPVSTITVDMGMPNVSRNLQMGVLSRSLTWNFQNGAAVFAINPGLGNIGQGSSADVMLMYGTINGATSFLKTGGGKMDLYRTANVTGPVTIDGGILRLRSQDSIYGRFDGATSYNVVGQGVALDLILSSTIPNNSVLGTTSAINLKSGGLTLGGSSSQMVGQVNLESGRNLIGNYSNSDKSLILTQLNRTNFATVNFLGNNQGGRSVGVGTLITINGNDSNILAGLIGGGGAAGTTNISILPWATASVGNANEFSPADNSAWSGAELVTYTTAGGFRALNASEYYNANTTTLLSGAAAQDNVKLASATQSLTDNQTVNAISSGMTSTITISSDKKLTVTSGAITTGGYGLTISGGILDTGSQALIVSGRSQVFISSAITNSITDQNTAGVILANVGNGVYLDGNNSYGGMTLVQGYITLRNDNALPAATELRIDRNGRTIIGNSIKAKARVLSGNGLIEFQIANNSNKLSLGTATTIANNTLAVGNGGTIAPGDQSVDTVGTLILGSNVNNLVFEAGSSFAVDIASATSFDSLQNINTNGTNTLRIDGGTIYLTLIGDYAPEVGTSWLLTSGFTVTSGDASLMSAVDNRGYDYTVAFQGNNLLVTLSAVPEPSTVALFALGGFALAWAGKRRAFRR